MPEDINRKRDVYSWKDGRTRLLSSGVDRNDANFVDADPSGTDIYIATTARLVAQDTDTLRDLYSVRREGGLPMQNLPAAEQSTCRLEQCQGPAHAPGGKPQIGSADLRATPTPSARKSAKSTRKQSLRVNTPKQSHGPQAKLRVTVPGAGTIRVSGPGVQVTSRKVRGAGGYAVMVRLTGTAKRSLRTAGSKRVTATVRFAPRRGAVVKKSVPLRFAQPGHAKQGRR